MRAGQAGTDAGVIADRQSPRDFLPRREAAGNLRVADRSSEEARWCFSFGIVACVECGEEVSDWEGMTECLARFIEDVSRFVTCGERGESSLSLVKWRIYVV